MLKWRFDNYGFNTMTLQWIWYVRSLHKPSLQELSLSCTTMAPQFRMPEILFARCITNLLTFYISPWIPIVYALGPWQSTWSDVRSLQKPSMQLLKLASSSQLHKYTTITPLFGMPEVQLTNYIINWLAVWDWPMNNHTCGFTHFNKCDKKRLKNIVELLCRRYPILG